MYSRRHREDRLDTGKPMCIRRHLTQFHCCLNSCHSSPPDNSMSHPFIALQTNHVGELENKILPLPGTGQVSAGTPWVR